MVPLIFRSRFPSHFRILTVSLRLPLCGMRSLPPMLMLLSFLLSLLSSRSQQRVVATVEESVLKTEMAGLESQEEDDPKRILFFKPMSWLGQIRPHRRDESWSASL
jgi:hypothetical protein